MTNTKNKSPLVRAAIALLWQSLRKDLFDTYRPELHYMRGPGPRWRAKHAVRSETQGFSGLASV